ncbi:uncharacterized protein LOC129803581 [Phlebotomus papatasi]|uniref:uncharacterized protein LOC129803581 n=1 Tax=Phlebotomus papatasi TaxID=29031 RepID=UPI002483AA43|nr:uncharacterized protein LOC129803581 [Phlebotomus papatasi]
MAPPEHSPGPTATRAVYGFSMFLLFKTLFIMYVIWAFVPDTILRDMLSLTYLPDKYFAIFIPMLILVAVSLFAFFIYPGINLTITPHPCDISTVKDPFSVTPCLFKPPGGKGYCKKPVKTPKDSWEIQKFCENHENSEDVEEEITIHDFCDCPEDTRCFLRENPNYLQQLRRKKQIPKVCDLPLSSVCPELYGGGK